MNQSNFSVVILAAGQGTRMRSDTHKVLHPIAGKPMLLHLLSTVDSMGADRRVVVVGKGREQLEKAVAGHGVSTALQSEQKGTGHAVQMAEEALAGFNGAVLILYGDTPFVTSALTLRKGMRSVPACRNRPPATTSSNSPATMRAPPANSDNRDAKRGPGKYSFRANTATSPKTSQTGG